MKNTVNPHQTCGRCEQLCKTDARCARCKRIRYCGKECQTKHWPTHKLVCATQEEMSALIEKECGILINNEVFCQLCACLRKYNEEIRAASMTRRVCAVVNAQSREQLPPSLRELGDYAFSMKFGDAAPEDMENGEAAWEVAMLPSKGDARVRMSLSNIPKLREDIYNRFKSNGTLDGSQPVIFTTQGELVNIQQEMECEAQPNK